MARVEIRRTCEAIAAVAFIVLSPPSVASGQEPPKIQAGGGYLHVASSAALFDTPITPSGGGPGWFIEMVGNLTPYVAGVGQIAGNYYDVIGFRGLPATARSYAFLGGVRASVCCRMVVPFAQALAGRVQASSETPQPSGGNMTISDGYLALAFGGGVDVREFHVVADVMRVQRCCEESGWTFRIAAGVIFPRR